MVDQQPSEDPAAEAAPQPTQRAAATAGPDAGAQAPFPARREAACAGLGPRYGRDLRERARREALGGAHRRLLVSIGWGKFIVLSILLFALAAITQSAFHLRRAREVSDIETPST